MCGSTSRRKGNAPPQLVGKLRLVARLDRWPNGVVCVVHEDTQASARARFYDEARRQPILRHERRDTKRRKERERERVREKHVFLNCHRQVRRNQAKSLNCLLYKNF